MTRHFWNNKSPDERLNAVEFLREHYYIIQGYKVPPSIIRELRIIGRQEVKIHTDFNDFVAVLNINRLKPFSRGCQPSFLSRFTTPVEAKRRFTRLWRACQPPAGLTVFGGSRYRDPMECLPCCAPLNWVPFEVFNWGETFLFFQFYWGLFNSISPGSIRQRK